jgi:hypothetical protein
MMKLEDWLLISGDVTVVNEIPSVDAAVPEAEAEAEVEAEAVPEAAVPEAVPLPLPQRDVGTKLRWVLDDETYRIAIATANGILQVKSVTDGESERVSLPDNARSWQRENLKKTFFTTEEEWRASLPQGGEVHLYGPPQKNVPLVVAGTSDVEKIEQLSARFKIRAGVYQQSSPLNTRELTLGLIFKMENIIACSEKELCRSKFESKLCESYKGAISVYKKTIQDIDAMSEAQKNRHEFRFTKYKQSKQKLFITLANGIFTQISPSNGITRFQGDADIPRAIFCHYDRRLYSSLDEMNPFKRDGHPVIQASYRTKMIDLTHLFPPHALA